MDKRRDLAVSLVVAALGAAIVILAFDLPIGRVRDPIGTRTMPIVVGAVICAGGVALAVRRLLRWRSDPVEVPADGAEDDRPDLPAKAWRALAVWALCFGYVVLLSRGGFLILTPLLIAASLWLMGVRAPVRLAAVSLVPVAVMYWLLGIVLNVRLPLGPFEPYLG